MLKPQGGIPNFESGKVVLSTVDLQVLKVDLSSKRIYVDVEDKAFIKRVIAMRSEIALKQPNAEEGPTSISGSLAMVRSLAETFCSRGISITFLQGTPPRNYRRRSQTNSSATHNQN